MELKEIIGKSAVAIKGSKVLPLNFDSKLVADYGFESLDIIDFFFEVQKLSGIQLDLAEIAEKVGAQSGRRFNDITFQEILVFLQSKMRV